MKRLSFSATVTLSVCLALMAMLLYSSPSQAGKKKPSGGAYDLIVLAPINVQVTKSLPEDLDDSGNVVGSYLDADMDWHGFYYDRAENEYLLFGPGVMIQGLNNRGEMVGDDLNTDEGLYWRSPQDTDPARLAPLGGHTKTFARGINDAGIIIGQSQGDGFWFKVVWKVSSLGVPSAPIELPLPVGYSVSRVSDISEQIEGVTDVVGLARSTENLPDRAVRWTLAVDANGPFVLSGPTDLNPLSIDDSSADGVNSMGDVVGRADSWPFLKPAGQPLQPLPGLKKATTGHASGINDNGQIVGNQGYIPRGSAGIDVQIAVLWPNATTIVDLNKKVVLGAGETLEYGSHINNKGHILAWGYFPGVTDTGNLACLLIPR